MKGLHSRLHNCSAHTSQGLKTQMPSGKTDNIKYVKPVKRRQHGVVLASKVFKLKKKQTNTA